ncbi:MAG: intein-containing RctB family protein [Candidatus Odinarchaeota archaeon]|nr:intein-containing RctB family protein [Candidatus Odinarchaeota archaeon]
MIKESLKRVDNFIWEIPMSFNPSMNVPARIYADEVLINKMLQDNTLRQLVNVAQLPGIYKYAIVLPDGHQGYGFPIGGVAALDYEEGVISPGGVGYDINCLAPGSKILTEHGYWIKVEDLPRKFRLQGIKVYNVSEGHNDSSKVVFIAERGLEEREVAVRITTEMGRVIEGSEDHPVLTPKGYIPLRSIKEGSAVIVYPFDGVEYEEKRGIILSEDDFRGEDRRIVRYLKDRGLLPLQWEDPKVGVLARILGFAFGGGNLTYTNGRLTLEFYGEEGDLRGLRRELESLGVKSSLHVSKRGYHVDKTESSHREGESNSTQLRVTSRSFAILMHKLGMPLSEKNEGVYHIPRWILEAPKWVKRNFLAGLFGADASEVEFKHHSPLPINLTQIKKEEFKEDLLEFLNDVATLLREFGVKARVHEVGSDGERVAYRLSIAGEENIRRFLGCIGYEYSLEKKTMALLAYEYLRRKRKVREERRNFEKIDEETYDEKKGAIKAREFDKGEVKGFVERNVYEFRSDAPALQDFLTFEEFVREFGYEGGFVADKVVKVEKVSPSYDRFYDVGVYHESHNFIANGVVVHNCGVRLLRTNLRKEDIKDKIPKLLDALFRNVPSGVGSKGKLRMNRRELDDVMRGGASWAVEHGYGWKEDIESCEENGRLEFANPDLISDKARKRGMPQLGTLGSGNHFLEIQYVEKIYDREKAKVMGIVEEGQITVMIHTGSRGFGHQVCSDFLKVMYNAKRKYNLRFPDPELSYAPTKSKEGQDYSGAMACAANYAWANRQMITHWTREAFEMVLGTSAEDLDMYLIYDVAHNIAKIEEHKIDGSRKKVIVHRKGATRAFPPGNPKIPEKYRKIGQPVLIPGSMGTASYVLVGTERSMEISFGSTAHGAGRVLSRAAAVKRYWSDKVRASLMEKGIMVKSASRRVLSEEAPGAYKDVDRVVNVSHNLGIGTLVVKLRPIAVTKG